MNLLSAPRLFRTLCVLGTAGCLGSAHAASVTYTGPNFGTWSSASFWSNGSVPGPGDAVSILNTGSTDLWLKADVSYGQPGLSSLLVNGSGNGWAIADVYKNLAVSGTTTLGSSGRGAIEQQGGNQDLGTLILGASGTASVGSYTLRKGNLIADDLIVGHIGSGGFGHLKGNVTVGNDLIVGNGSSVDSLYTLQKGKLTVADSTVIGGAGDGFFEQGKATTDFGRLTVGQASGFGGSVKQFGGTIRTDSATIGDGGEGHYELYAGVHAVAGNLTLGGSAGGTGVYLAQGGALSVGGKIFVGGSGEAFFGQSVGQVSAAGGVEVRAGEYQLVNNTLTTRGLSVAAGGYFTTEGTKSTIRTSGDIVFDAAAGITTRDATLVVAKDSQISLSAIQADSGASFSALSNTESWNAVTLEKNVTLTLEGTAGVDAIYVNSLNIGSKDPFRVESLITGNGVDMYYNASLKANKYLKGGTYDLGNGGELIPVFAPAGSSGVIKGGGGIVVTTGNNFYGGTLTITGTVSVPSGSTYTLGLNPGSSFDAITLAGEGTLLTLNDFSLTLFDFTTIDPSLNQAGTYLLTGGEWVLTGEMIPPEIREASGTLSESHFSAPLASTVPEPTTALLTLLGVAALAGRRRSRR